MFVIRAPSPIHFQTSHPLPSIADSSPKLRYPPSSIHHPKLHYQFNGQKLPWPVVGVGTASFHILVNFSGKIQKSWSKSALRIPTSRSRLFSLQSLPISYPRLTVRDGN